MKRHVAGTIVRPGLYWRARPFDIQVVSSADGILGGLRGDRYLRVPLAAVPLFAIAGFVLGGLYVVLLPVVGAVMLVVAGATRVWRWLETSAEETIGGVDVSEDRRGPDVR